MEADEKWYFSKEQLSNTPSRKCGYDADRELSCRQQAANFIQDMGQRLQVTQLCINTAIVYMHRFYVFHSFTNFHRNAMAAASLFLAAKVEEQPRKLEHVIKVAQMCLHRELPPLDTKSEQYLEQAQDLVMNENVLLQTLGFDVAIDHPHTHVVRCCHLVKASKDLAQTSYFMASNSLHLTTMCLQYKPTVVACFCIHLACKWSNWEIPLSNESKSWFWYVDRSVTQELLEQLTDEFLRIFDKCPSRLKRKISANQNMTGYHMGVNELNQKRMPGPGGDAGVGVSFQQPTARLRPAEDNRKKPDNNMIPPNHRPMPGPDFKKQPPPIHTGQREMSAYGPYHGGPSTSQQSGSHQSAGAQFQYPAGGSSFPNAPPRPAPVPKHAVRPEATFLPPKQRSHVASPAAPPAPRPVKTEMPPPGPPPPKHYNFPHQAAHRNGTSHLENQPHKSDKYPPDKHHQKSHSKSYDARQAGGSWVSDVSNRNVSNDKYKTETPSKSERPYIKPEIITEPYSNESYHTPINKPVALANVKQEPPLPPPPLPPPPPPPPPPTVSHQSKPSSIFSPDKMSSPMPDSPLRDIKPVIQNTLLLSPPPSGKSNRSRTTSSSSEPELIPVMPKLEEMSGFESIGKGIKAIKLPGKVADNHHKDKRKNVSANNVKQEPKPQEANHPVHAVVAIDSKPPAPTEAPPVDTVDLTKREHKKKKKHKEHREHKEHKEHKDKDREKDREKKKDKHKEKHKDKHKDAEAKDKDKEKERHRGDPAPIKITIPKDKLNIKKIEDHKQNCLKIKILKEKIKDPVDQPKASSSLKIKIRPTKDSMSSSSSGSSKKRERSHGEDNRHSHPTKHAKTSKTNGDYRLA